MEQVYQNVVRSIANLQSNINTNNMLPLEIDQLVDSTYRNIGKLQGGGFRPSHGNYSISKLRSQLDELDAAQLQHDPSFFAPFLKLFGGGGEENIESLRVKTGKITTDLNELKNKITELVQAIAKMKAKLEKAISECAAHTAAIDEKTGTIEACNSELNAMKQQNTTLFETFSTMLTEIETRVTDVSARADVSL